MCLGPQPFDPQGINSSRGIGCKHNGIRHPARGDCCTAPRRCDTHVYCCWDIYWIKVDDVVLYFFSLLKRRRRKPCGASTEQKLMTGIYIWQTKLIFIPDHYPNRTAACVYLKWLKSYHYVDIYTKNILILETNRKIFFCYLNALPVVGWQRIWQMPGLNNKDWPLAQGK